MPVRFETSWDLTRAYAGVRERERETLKWKRIWQKWFEFAQREKEGSASERSRMWLEEHTRRTLKDSGWMNEEERPWQVISQKIFVINDFAYLSCASPTSSIVVLEEILEHQEGSSIKTIIQLSRFFNISSFHSSATGRLRQWWFERWQLSWREWKN